MPPVTPHPIDRIDGRGNIREHLTLDDRLTLCGIAIGLRQRASLNARCRRCDAIAKHMTAEDRRDVESVVAARNGAREAWR